MSDRSADRLRHNVAKLTAIRFLMSLHLVSAVLVPFFRDWGGLTLSEIFWLNAWFVFCMFALEVPTGTVADLLGRKVSLAAGSIVGAIAALVYVSTPSLLVFAAAELLAAVAMTLHSGADEALAYDTLAELGRTDEAQLVIARMQSALLAAIVLGATAGGFVADAWGLTAPLASYVIPCTLALLLSLTLVEPRQARPSSRREYVALLTSGLRFVRHHPVVLAFGIELALVHGLVRTIIWLYQPLLGDDGMSIAHYGLVHAAAALGQIVLLQNVDRVDRLLGSRRRLMIVGGLVCGGGFIGLALSSSLALTVALIVLVFTFGMSRAPLYSAYIHHYVTSDNRATVMSAFSMLRMLAVVIVGAIVGPAAEASMPATLVAIGIALVVVAAMTRVEESHLVDRAVA